MFGAIAGGIASALAGGAMSKLFGGGQKAASGGIQGDVLATDNNTVGMGDAGIKSAIQGRSEERFSRNAETDLVCRLLLEKKKQNPLSMFTTVTPDEQLVSMPNNAATPENDAPYRTEV